MQKNTLVQAAGCLKTAVFHLVLIICSCVLWQMVLGREGILAGIAAYLSLFFGKAFARVFGDVEKRPLASADEQPPENQ